MVEDEKSVSQSNRPFIRLLRCSRGKFTFAEVLGIQGQAVSGQGLQQQLVAGPPARLRDGWRHALHGRHALEERRLAVEANELVELRQDAVALDLLLL